MSSDGLIAAVALGLAGGAVLAWWERQKLAATPPPSSACDALKGLDMTAYYACLAAGGLLPVLGEINPFTGDVLDADHANAAYSAFMAKDATNKQLNGAVDTPITDTMRLWMGWKSTAPDSAGGGVDSQVPDVVTPLEGTVLKFKNGCVPFAGAPGWTACAKGTADMFGGNGQITYDNYDDAVPKFRFVADAAKVGTGAVHGPGFYASFEDSGCAQAVDGQGNPGCRIFNWDRDNGWGDSWDAKVQTTEGDPSTGLLKPRFHGFPAGGPKDFPFPFAENAGYFAGKPFACPAYTLPEFAAPAGWTGPRVAAQGSSGVRCAPDPNAPTHTRTTPTQGVGSQPGGNTWPGTTPSSTPKPTLQPPHIVLGL